MSCLWVKVEIMASMRSWGSLELYEKLYEKLGLIGGGESARLQESMEDCGTPGIYIPVYNL